MVSQVSERGQITIERSIREQLGIEPGMVAYQSVVDGRLEVVFLPAPHRGSLYGALKQRARGAAPKTRAEMNAAVREALADRHPPVRPSRSLRPSRASGSRSPQSARRGR